ncbi:MAG: RNA polymerase factor sigma-54 [Rikenellaceae bacterium]
MTTISNRQVQKLLQKLSPQQIQMIKLLELPTVLLEQRIKQEIEENPVLDEVEHEEEEGEVKTKYNLDEISKDDFMPGYKLNSNNQSKDDKHGSIPISNALTLTEFLDEQLSYIDTLDDRRRNICRYLIGSLDNNGYLRRDIENIVDDLAFMHSISTTDAEVEEMLKVIQTLEPAGVGARNLKETLLIQLRRKIQTSNVKLAYKVLNGYFEEFSKKHYDKIMSRLNLPQSQFKEIISVIISLSPKPANQYSELMQSEPTTQIIPDFILDNENGNLELSLNRYNTPDIKINSTYVKMLENLVKSSKQQKSQGEDASTDKNAVGFIKQKIDSARWFISAIKQRDATLMMTMHTIFEFQRPYFEDGDQTKLRPMILRDIAERTGLDVSTISRVVNSKYIQTHFGILPLKFFFSEAMYTDNGEEVSSREIKKILSDCVSGEDKEHPLTDEALMEILRDKGYQIARRTVAKYREMLGIAVARLRKEMI